MRICNKITQRMIKILKCIATALVILVFGFSDFVSILPEAIQKNQLAENFTIKKTQAATNGDGLIFYGLSGNTTPQTRLYDNASNSFSAVIGTLAGAQPVIVRMKSSPIKEEFIAAYQDNAGNLRVMCYDGAAWSNEWTIAVASSGTPTTRRFDIAYETNSGDVTVAYSRNVAATNALAYRTKSSAAGCGPANWSAAANFPATSTITTGTVQWVKAVRDERASSNLGAFIWADSNQDLGGVIWDGSVFANLKLLETALEIIGAAQDVDSFDLAFESLSGNLMVVWGSGGANGTNGAWYNRCVGGTSVCVWTASRTAILSGAADDATVLDLSADPTSDRMAFSSIGNAGGANSADLQAAYWSGSAWTGYRNLDITSEMPAAGMRLTQTAWLTNGAATRWILVYDDATGNGIGWYSAAPGSTPVKQIDWGATPSINDIRGRYEVDNNPFDSSQLMLTLSDSTNSIFAKMLSMDAAGTFTWTDADGGASLGSKFSHPQQGFSFAYRRFIPITTPTIVLAPLSGQIGSEIIITGNNFGASGSATINGKNAAVISWGSTSIILRVPGQAPVAGKIQVTRSSDGAVSNLYPVDPSNFSISGPSVSSSSLLSADNGQNALVLNFIGAGIDTDGMPPGAGVFPAMKLKNNISGIEVVGTSLNKIADYSEIQATFDLTAVADADVGPVNSWNLIIINPDSLQGEKTGSFTITTKIPTISTISPDFGLNTETVSPVTIIGSNFDNNVSGKLKLGIDEILSAPVFTRVDSGTLNGGSFNLSGKTAAFWDVMVTNNNGNMATKSSGFEIRSAKPSDPDPVKLYQFKTSGDIAEPPATNIAVRSGINSTTVYFRMNIAGGLTGPSNPYTPQIEVKTISDAFDGLPGSIINGIDVVYDGVTPALGWANAPGLLDNTLYHWRARVKNSAGTSNWVPFGGGNPETEQDFYIDIALPTIDYVNCATAAPASSVTDLSAIIQWNTFDTASGAQSNFPGQGTWAKVQVDYKKTTEPSWTTTLLSSWEDSLPHKVILSGLAPATNYTFRMRSQDWVGNEAISPECTFLTTSSRPIKTVEFFIGQETDSYKNLLPDGISKKYFVITLPESPGAAITVKSAFIEITGVSSASATQTVNIGLLRGDQTSGTGPAGENYVFNSDSTTTPFTIIFNALNPSGGGQESVANITTGVTPYDYTLFLKGDGVTDIWLFSAKLIITYSYAQ